MEKTRKYKILMNFLKIVFICSVIKSSIIYGVEKKPPRVSKELLNFQEALEDVITSVKPAVVSITASVTLKQEIPQYEFFFGDPFEFFFGDPFEERPQRRQLPKKYYERKIQGGGSGVIIDEKGHVLTNYHVIQNAQTVEVTLPEEKDKRYKAEVVGTDPLTDLAVLKIKGGKSFPYATLGNSDELKIGDFVIAIGSPFGLEQTVTMGIVSANRQSLVIEGKQYTNLIQTDAAINRGNSGGPLINIKGEIIGINTAIYAPTGVFSGIGFAIPINKAKEILSDLIEKGKVVRGWLGVEIRDVDDVIAKQFGVKESRGVLINKVLENSPAEKSGIERGDIVLEVDGKKVKDSLELQKIIRSKKPGQKVNLKILRDRNQKNIDVKLGELETEKVLAGSEEPEKESKTEEWLGIKVSNITENIARSFGVDEKETGVIITDIDSDKKGAEMGLATGDIIKGINKIKIKNVSDFKKAVKTIDLKSGVVFDLIRSGKPLYITYKE